MSFRFLILASALATALPSAASAFSMRCDEPGKRLSSPYSSIPGRDFASQRRSALPEWLSDRRQGFRPTFARPARPDWVRERRAQRALPQRPDLPEWVQARRDGHPGFGSGDAGRPARPAPQPAVPAAFERGPAPSWGVPGRLRPVGFRHWGRPAWAGPYGAQGPLGSRGSSASRWAGYGYRNPWPLLPPIVAPLAAPQSPVSEPEPLAKAEPATHSAPAPIDSDQDGVFNPADLCPDSAAGARVDAFGCEQNAAIVLRGVNFKTDSAELTDQSLAILDGVSATLVANPDIRVEIAGHTDSDGDEAYNKDLSQRRSESVVAYLAGKGVPADNMTARGYGEEQPVADNDSVEGKAQNRRVELNRM